MKLSLVSADHSILRQKAEDFDFENNISGGCLVGGYMPNIGCIECGWKGLQNPYTGEIIDKDAVDLEEE